MADDDNLFAYGLEADDYQQLLQIEEANRRMLQDNTAGDGAAGSFIANVGTFKRPQENTWAAHSQTIFQHKLDFDPQHHIFDKIVAQSCKNPAIYDPSNPHYAEYEPMRHNIAVLRNYVSIHMYGSVIDAEEKQDRNKYEYIQQMAATVGTALRNGDGFMGMNAGIPLNTANIEGEGAAAMYEALFKKQKQNDWLAPMRFVDDLFNQDKTRITRRDWRLPPIKFTPFGPLALEAPPPTNMPPSVAPAAATGAAAAMTPEILEALKISGIGDELTAEASGFNSVASLRQPVKTRAIEIAREILDKLKITYGDVPLESMLDFAPERFKETVSDFNAVALTYEQHLPTAMEMDPTLADDPVVREANEAIGVMGAQAKMYAFDEAMRLGDKELAASLKADLDKLPERWLKAGDLKTSDLIAKVEDGMTMMLAAMEVAQESEKDENELLRDYQQDKGVQGQHRKYEALAFNDRYAEMLATRRQAKQQIVAHRHHSNVNGVPNDVKSASAGAAAGMAAGANFDTLLSGGDLSNMRNSMNAETSGNFDVAAPSTAKRVVSEEVSKKKKEPVGNKDQKQDQQQQKQRLQAKIAHRSQQTHRNKHETRSAEQRQKQSQDMDTKPVPPPRRDRDQFSR